MDQVDIGSYNPDLGSYSFLADKGWSWREFAARDVLQLQDQLNCIASESMRIKMAERAKMYLGAESPAQRWQRLERERLAR